LANPKMLYRASVRNGCFGRALAEASVAVAVSTPHRADSFAAAEWILETLKQRAPIWKRDLRPDGYTEWVEGNPVT